MPSVAEQLRQARESMRLDIHQVAETTKLKTDHIRALEQGDYETFTAPIYLRGSLRTYAKMLKLDAVKLLEQLDAEQQGAGGAQEEATAPRRSKTPVDSATLILSRVNWVVAAAVLVLVAIALIGNWTFRALRNHQTADPLRNLGPGAYQPSLDAGETLPLPTNSLHR